MPPDAQPIVELTGVTKDFGDEVVTRVLHGIDLRVMPGELTALVGPSGSGKSTLLNLLGLLDRPTSGSLKIDGRETQDLREEERTALRGKSLGFVFQFHHLVPALSAAQNVMLPLSIASGRTTREHLAQAVLGLAAVGLAERAHERVQRLSGGQQQRVAIARALIHRPRLLLADEPTGNLDTQTARDVFSLLWKFNRTHHLACILVTHDPSLADRCDRIFTLVDGRIVSTHEGKSIPSGSE